ncbi:PASTA domain-containing protein [Kribbella sp. CWNU-51]
MNESKLTELLERADEQAAVGPSPLDAVGAGATRGRRLRTVLASAAAVTTVLAVIGVTNVLTASGQSGGVTIISPEPEPAAMRLVGFGHAAIAVPKVWGTNFSRCGTPRKDTVLVDDSSAMSSCHMRRPKDVDTVELSSTPTIDFHADETFTIDGVRAERQRTTCPEVRLCRAAVGIPSLQVWFRAESSTSADEVDRTLARIEIVTDRIGVPSYQSLDERPTGAAYAKVLARMGLQTAFLTRTSPSYLVGQVFGVSPRPGTLLEPGDTVTVTVVK